MRPIFEKQIRHNCLTNISAILKNETKKIRNKTIKDKQRTRIINQATNKAHRTI